MDKINTIHNILSQREDFLVIGLTGRMGSGCSKVANLLSLPFNDLLLSVPAPQSGMRSFDNDERVSRIIAEFVESHWLRFEVIQVGAIISSFILDNDEYFINDICYGEIGKQATVRNQLRKHILDFFCHKTLELLAAANLININNFAEKIEPDMVAKIDTTHLLSELILKIEVISKNIVSLIPDSNEKELILRYSSDTTIKKLESLSITKKPNSIHMWKRIGEAINFLYRTVLRNKPSIHRRKYLENIDNLVDLFATFYITCKISSIYQKPQNAHNDLFKYLQKINENLESNSNSILQIEKFIFVKFFTPWLGRAIREFLNTILKEDAYSRLFQRYGQMIRYYGKLPNITKEEQKNISQNKKDIFAIPRKINQHIKILRHPFSIKDHRPVRIVVDSIKNMFEAVYLRYRYSAFYLWAITTDSPIREARLRNKHLNDIQIRKLEWNEYPDKGGEVIRNITKMLNQQQSTSLISIEEQYNIIKANFSSAEAEFYFDILDYQNPSILTYSLNDIQNPYFTIQKKFNDARRNFFSDNTYAFYTQDVDSCVTNADVFIFNNSKNTTDHINNRKLLEAILRNVSLAMYPGLVRPTPVERCMQIAFSAKVNSGCLSRQVGAVVTDSDYNILSIGWNDVPCGEIPCIYKNVNDVIAGADQDAYSDYELYDTEFRKQIARYKLPSTGIRGLPYAYCFKNAHKDGRDPMRSRAMHAEEKALAICGQNAEGGYLFTTSSPCEMCSKNAKNHKIRKIYYLEAYPGISQAQYINSGNKDNRAELILFSGAVGRAYMQMYTPLLPHKDILEYLGVEKT